MTGRREAEARLSSVERSWGPRSVTLSNGPGRGRRQIDLRHLGGLAVTVEPDQFLDLGEAFWRGELVSFAPASTSPRAETWGRRWLGGLLTTCGLAAVGEAPAEHGGMHGRAQLIPATLTRAEGRWEGDRYRLEVAGHLREGGIFEGNLTTERSITAERGVSRIRIVDVVRNEGFEATPVKLLYHLNVGWPVVDTGTRVAAEAAPPGGAGREWQATLSAPQPGADEVVDALVAVPDHRGWAAVTVSAPGTAARPGIRVAVRYRAAELPFLTVWRSQAAGAYALGIEPGTCWPSHADGPDSGKVGRVLEPGESVTTDLELEFGAGEG
ncbi:MAG: DUF4432 family protein [Propioniciclava sp.]